MKFSTAFLASSLAISMFVVLYDAVLKPEILSRYYDDRPPINFRVARLEKSALRSGETLTFTVEYTKRVECLPPLAPPTDLRFRVWEGKAQYRWLPHVIHRQDPASDSPRHTSVSVPMPKLRPGAYQFQFEATYRCHGSSGPLTVESQKLPFIITEK